MHTLPSHAFRALGTGCRLVVVDESQLELAIRIVDEELRAIDLACSRFREDSELQHLNRSAGETVKVSKLLFQALKTALRAAHITDGDVDPTVGRAMCAIGYNKSFEHITEEALPTSKMEIVPGWQLIELNASASTVCMPASCSLDLGATAKAFAADRAAARVANETGAGVLLSLGGDIATAGKAPEGNWHIRIADNHEVDDETTDDSQMIEICGGGVATSSVTVRAWKQGEAQRHHIINPRTGTSAHVVWKTVTVAAVNCTDANIASTAAIIRGEDAPHWLNSNGMSARLTRPDNSIVRLGGWPEAVVR